MLSPQSPDDAEFRSFGVALGRLTRVVGRGVWARVSLVRCASLCAVIGAGCLVLTLVSPDLPRWPWLALAGAAALVVALISRRAIPAQGDLVAYVDRRLGAGESIVSTHDAVERENITEFDALALRSAVGFIAEARPADVRPPVATSGLWSFLFGVMFFAGALLVPEGRSFAELIPELLVDEAPVLRRIERLATVAPVDDEEREALRQIAEDAAELRRALAEGMDLRDALDSMERLEDQLEAVERARESERQAAAAAAAEALEDEPAMARAVAERDMEALDREVERAAARRESADRERAHQALERAAAAAREAGDEELAESLLRRDRQMQRRSAQADLARQLAEAMPELMEGELGRQLERLSRDGEGGELDEAMVRAMEEAWSRLTPEERRRLAEAMRQQAEAENDQAQEPSEGGETPEISAEEYERMLRQALEDLDRMRSGATGSGQQGQGMPMPRRGSGQGQGQGAGQGQGQGQGQASGQASGQGQGQGNGSGAGGTGGGTGSGPEGGETAPVEAGDGPLARVRPRLGAGVPSRSWVEWTTPRAGEGGAPGVGAAGGEVGESGGGGIDRSRIPADYEEHVRTYFGGDQP